MSIFPFNIDTQQALYSAVPLALDINILPNLFSRLENPYGDCQFFTTQELPKSEISFRNKKYSILKQSSTARNIPLPFTTLLVGPSYACKEVLSGFDTWAKIDKDSIAIPISSMKQTNNIFWAPIQHPNVWAQATFSNVMVTSSQPIQLEKVLKELFDFPIIVNCADISISNTHNELAAWLAAIYALSAARNLHRTVLCHSRSWAHHLRFFYNAYHTNNVIPELWKPLVATLQIPQKQKLKKNNFANSYAESLSRYQMKKNTFNINTFFPRIIGKGNHCAPIISKEEYASMFPKKGPSLLMEHSNDTVVVFPPFNVDKATKRILRKIIAHYLHTTPSHISFEHKFPTDKNTEHILVYPKYYFSILANLVLLACKKVDSSKKHRILRSTLSKSSSCLKQEPSACCIVEFNVNIYSRELILSKTTITLDVGHIPDKIGTYATVENLFFTTLYSLCGHDILIHKDFELSIEFIDGQETKYISSFSHVLRAVVIHAMTDALSQSKDYLHFPIRGALSNE